MVDYLSRSRLYATGYRTPDIRKPAVSYRDLYRDKTPNVFQGDRPAVHDCRLYTAKSLADDKRFDAWVLSHGLTETYKSVNELHYKETSKEDSGKKIPDKLLINTSGNFKWPRGLTTNAEGDIIIADTMNHRILIFNNSAVLKTKFGSRGSSKGKFDEPTGVSCFPNDDIVVADKKNKRIQVFSPSGKFKYKIDCVDEPYSIASDQEYNLAVGTCKGSLEIYTQEGKLLTRFDIGLKVNSSSKNGTPINICLNDNHEVIVSEPVTKYVKYFNFSGELLYKFKPEATEKGLSTHPSGITISPIGQVILADALNHTVNLYSERGILLHQLIGPTDDIGAVQTVTVGAEGHLICTEYSSNGEHALKIFRYRDCACHRFRPGSSKRGSRVL